MIVEQTIGVFKRRFNCIHAELRLQPQRAYVIVAVGHNDMVEPLPVQDDIQQSDDNDASGIAVGNNIIQNFFQ